MKANLNPMLARGLDALPENDADTVYGALWDDERFNASLMQYLHDDTMTRMDLILELEARVEALAEQMRRER